MKMVRNELCVSIPSYFRCPISMEVMKCPVSLSTGVTYDRSSIQAWLDGGHNTCPATMLPLSSPSFVPNLSLHRLIHLWSLSQCLSLSSPGLPLLNSDNLSSLSLKNVLDEAWKSEDYRKMLGRSDDFLASIVGILTKFDPNCGEIENLECALTILDEIDGIDEKIHKLIFRSDFNNCLCKFVFVLQNGSSELKIAAARVLHKIGIDNETKLSMINETPNLLHELYNLIASGFDPSIEAALSTLISLSKSSRLVKSQLVRLGTVRTVGEIISGTERSASVVERSLEMLEVLSTCMEGRAAICGDERCVAEIVRRLMKVSLKATEHGVTVLWSVCHLFMDEKVKEIVGRSNGVAKCLLLLQSNCLPIVKQMCGDLVKVLRANDKSCLARYDTKTTHIMPY